MREEICIIFISILNCSLAFNLSCPEPGQWNYRATAYCFGDLNKYTCLLDTTKTRYSETCDGPRIEIEGYKSTTNRNNFDTAKCRSTRYQNIDFTTVGNSDCVFKKSKCEQEGQIVSSIKDDSSLEDTQCRCDYTKGYSFIILPREKCYCTPTAEDCSCFRQLCPSGEILSPDYQCITEINMTTSQWTCSNILITVGGSDGDRIIRQDSNMAEDDLKIGIKNRIAAAVSVMLLTIVMICLCIYRKRVTLKMTKEQEENNRNLGLCIYRKRVTVKMTKEEEENIRNLGTFKRQTNGDKPSVPAKLEENIVFATIYEPGPPAGNDLNENSEPVEDDIVVGYDQNVNQKPVESDNVSEASFYSFENSNVDEKRKDTTDDSAGIVPKREGNKILSHTEHPECCSNSKEYEEKEKQLQQFEILLDFDKKSIDNESITDETPPKADDPSSEDTEENAEKLENRIERDNQSDGNKLTDENPPKPNESSASLETSSDDIKQNAEKTDKNIKRDNQSDGNELSTTDENPPEPHESYASLKTTPDDTEQNAEDTDKNIEKGNTFDDNKLTTTDENPPKPDEHSDSLEKRPVDTEQNAEDTDKNIEKEENHPNPDETSSENTEKNAEMAEKKIEKD